MSDSLTLNGAMLAHISRAIEQAALTSGVLGIGDKRDWTPEQVGVTLKNDADHSHVLVRVAVLPPHGYPADRAAVYVEISRESGDWVFSEAPAFVAGLTFREYSARRLVALQVQRVASRPRYFTASDPAPLARTADHANRTFGE